MAYGRSMQGPQGSPGYNPYSKYPDIAGIVQQFMQNMMMQKQMKQQRGQQEWQRGMEEQKMASLEAHRQAQREEWQEPPTPPTKSSMQKEAEEVAKETGESVGTIIKRWRAKTPPRPSAFSEKKTAIERVVASGGMSKEQGLQALYKIKQEMSPEDKRRQGASIRDSNVGEIRKFYAGIPELIDKGQIKAKELRKMIKKTGEAPTSPQGYRLDMPSRYNTAILNEKDGVATVEDKDIIKNYDTMFKIFQSERKRYVDFDEWMMFSKAKNLEGLDKNQMKRWYDIYK